MHLPIRLAAPEDGGELLEIYAPYVEHSAVSFEVQVPSVREFGRRVEEIGRRYPYLVWEEKGSIAAYAYASGHRSREAYRYDAEVSVYARCEYHGSGVAARLYGCLFDILREQGYRNLYAGYTVPNEKSARFHEKMGFAPVGVYRNTGYKLGRWWDVVWMEKAIAPHSERPGEIRGIGDLPAGRLAEVFARACGPGR